MKKHNTNRSLSKRLSEKPKWGVLQLLEGLEPILPLSEHLTSKHSGGTTLSKDYEKKSKKRRLMAKRSRRINRR